MHSWRMRSNGHVGVPLAKPLTHIVVMSSFMGKRSDKLNKPRRVLRAFSLWPIGPVGVNPLFYVRAYSNGMLGVSNRNLSHMVVCATAQGGRSVSRRNTTFPNASNDDANSHKHAVGCLSLSLSLCLCVSVSASLSLRLCLSVAVSASESLSL